MSGKSCTAIGGPVGLGIGFMARVGIGLDTDILIIFVGDGVYDNIITHATDLWNDSCYDKEDWRDILW